MVTARFLQSFICPKPVSLAPKEDLRPSLQLTGKENQHFDLEFFMRSTDVGLYNVAKEIFSYLDPEDLSNLMEIGKTNKTFNEFLKKEWDFLWKKFEEAKLKILETGQVIACIG